MKPHPRPSQAGRSAAWRLGFGFALALPFLFPFGWAPFPSFVNEWLALLGWAWVTGLSGHAVLKLRSHWGAAAMAAALIAAAAGWSAVHNGRSGGVVLLTCLALTAFLACMAAGQAAIATRRLLWPALAGALLLAAMANAGVIVLQVWGDPAWLPETLRLKPGQRPGGLVGQANHVGVLMVWSLAAAGAWTKACESANVVRWPLLLLLALALAVTASRTAQVGWLLACAALLAHRPSRSLGLSAMVCGVLGFAAAWVLSEQAASDVLATHLREGSPTRWILLKGTWQLIQMNAWLGTGWGEFNFHWMLSLSGVATPLAVHHGHNLVLQILAELGVPLGILVLALLGLALFTPLRMAWQARHQVDSTPWFAMAMVAVSLVHSQFELPLWFTYWLLPVGYLIGLSGGAVATGWRVRLSTLGLLLGLAAALVAREWMQLMPLYAPPGDPAPLAQRIESGKASRLFSAWAWQYEAMSVESSGLDFARGAEAPFSAAYLAAWAHDLHRRGDTERADFLMQRMRVVQGPKRDWLAARCREASTHDFPCRSPRLSLGPQHFTPPAMTRPASAL